MSAPLNPSKGGSLKWAWALIDRHRRREHISPHQIEQALAAIQNVHGRSPIPGTPGHQFDHEDELREKHAPR